MFHAPAGEAEQSRQGGARADNSITGNGDFLFLEQNLEQNIKLGESAHSTTETAQGEHKEPPMCSKF